MFFGFAKCVWDRLLEAVSWLLTSMKSADEDRFDPMDLRSHAACRNAGYLTDRGRIHVFEIQKHELTIERLEALDELEEPLRVQALICIPRVVGLVRSRFELCEAHEISRIRAALPNDVRRGGIVRDAINPRPHRTALLEFVEAAPERDVNLLKQIAALVWIRLVRAHEPLEGWAVGG